MSVSDPYRARPGQPVRVDLPNVPTFEPEPGAICQRCGLHAPASATLCAECGAELRTTRVPAPGHQECWALVRLAFRCRSCDFASPLDGLELEERVHCAQCGALQRLEVAGWRTVFAGAHEIADLAWPQPEGRHPAPRIFIGEVNPFAKLASFSAIQIAGGSGAVLEASAAPGFPTCRVCGRGVLQIILTGPHCQTRCPHCGDAARYDTQKAHQLGGLAVLAPAERSDRPHVRLETAMAGGPVALLCPRCGGPLVVQDEDNVQCTHCECASYVPVRARRPRQGARSARPIFVAFRGPSAKRRQLETSQRDKLLPATIDAAAARLPQLAITLLAGAIALVVATTLLELTGAIDLF